MLLRFFYHLLTYLAVSIIILVSFSNAASIDFTKRATTIVAPTAYKISWTKSGNRASTGTSNGGLGYTFIATSGGITQSLVNQCAATCTAKATCGMYQIIQVSGVSQGTVICSLFNMYIASTKATYTSGPTGGTVVITYGIRNLSTPTGGSATTTTSTVAVSTITKSASLVAIPGRTTTTVSATITTSAVVSTASFPASPPGATLVQFAPCSSLTTATVPMFVNNQYGGSTATSAYIVQHGSGLNFQDYFTAVYNVIGIKGIIAAPNYYISSSAVAPNTWYQPSVNLAWSNDTYSWSVGNDATLPRAVSCSSYDVYDSLLTYFTNKSKFPNLTNVYFVSHSGGANMVSRYSQIYNGNFGVHIRYIIANSANQAYFTNARPQVTDSGNCSSAFQYPFQLVASGMPRYVSARYTDATTIFKTWITRDIVTLIGTYDTQVRYPGGVEDCASQAEGGVNRRERNYAWWAYENILAGTGTNVSAYTGYQQLLSSGATTLYKGTFAHQNCNIDGVGHDQNAMFNSSCGVAAMTTTTIPAGVGAVYDG